MFTISSKLQRKEKQNCETKIYIFYNSYLQTKSKVYIYKSRNYLQKYIHINFLLLSQLSSIVEVVKNFPNPTPASGGLVKPFQLEDGLFFPTF